MHVFSRGDHAPHQNLRLPGTPLRDDSLARGRVLLVGDAKTLDFREIFRIRSRSTKVLGICGQGSSSETVLAMLNRHPTLSSRQKPAFFVRCDSSSEGLRLRIWSRPPSISTQATCGTCSRGLPCCSGKGSPDHASVSASRCCHALLADPLGGPHDPLSRKSSNSASSFRSLLACWKLLA